MNDGFAAKCQHCGETHAVRLLDPPSPCARCEAPDPLDAATAAAVASAAERVRRMTANAQRTAARQDAAAGRFGAAMATFGGLSWVFFTLVAVSAVFSEVPPTLTGKALMRLVKTATGDTLDMAIVMAWWTLFAFAFIAALTLCATFATLFALRKPLAVAEALAPIEPGAPRRCRLCGAGLPGDGAERACASCGAKSLVRKGVSGPSALAIDEHLAAIERAPLGAPAAASRAPDVVVALAAAAPALVMLAQQFKITGTHKTWPELIPLVWALFAMAAGWCLLWLTRWSAEAPSLEGASIGARVLVQGRAYRVAGRLRASGDGTLGAPVLTLLDPEDDDHHSKLAVALDVGTRSIDVRAFEVHEGGAEFDDSIRTATFVEHTHEARGASSSLVALVEESPRWFVTDPANGAEPQWTMTPIALAADELLLLSPRA
jgi:hypothetical protein